MAEKGFPSSDPSPRQQTIKDEFVRGETISDRIRKLYEKMLYTDLEIVVSNTTGKTKEENIFSAHKTILAVGSDVFASMIYGAKKSAGGSSQIEIRDVNCEALGNLIRFLYTDEVDFGSDLEILETYAAAKIFSVPRLEYECAKELPDVEITVETIFQVLEMSTTHKIQEVREKCLKFIEDHTKEVFRSPYFEKVDIDTVEMILKLPRLSVGNECQLLSAMMSWARKSHPGIKMEESYESARFTVYPLLSHIRFLSMSSKEFCQCLDTFKGLLSESESLAILMEISRSGSASTNLPEWVNKERARRTSENISGNNKKILVNFGLVDTPSNCTPASCLTSVVKMTCFSGRNVLVGIKLQWKSEFGKTPSESSLRYTIKVSVQPKNFCLIAAKNQLVRGKEVTCNFKKPIFVSSGDKAKLEVEASELKGIEFLSYDPERNYSKIKGIPFTFRLRSSEKDTRFIISEIHLGKWFSSSVW